MAEEAGNLTYTFLFRACFSVKNINLIERKKQVQ